MAGQINIFMPYTGIRRHHQVIYDSRERFQERFWKYVSRTANYDDHWVWTGPVDTATGINVFTINHVVIPVSMLTPYGMKTTPTI